MSKGGVAHVFYVGNVDLGIKRLESYPQTWNMWFRNGGKDVISLRSRLRQEMPSS